MSVIGFWSASQKETGQTVAATTLATYTAVKHNCKTLLIDATFSDIVMERCFWKVNPNDDTVKKLNKGKIDISSGAEGLVSAVASNKTTPEIIKNFTRVVLKDRLDVLCGLKTKNYAEYTKSLMLYKDLIQIADKYYDLVFVDIEKTLARETTKALLGASHIIICDFTQNTKQFEEFYMTVNSSANKSIFDRSKVLTLLTNADENSKYNVKNAAKYIKEKNLLHFPYNPVLKDSTSDAALANFVLRYALAKTVNDKNTPLFNALNEIDKAIDNRLKELQYKV